MNTSLDLNLIRYQDELVIKQQDNKAYIWDLIRTKWLVLQPEEMVRQLLILYLIKEEGINRNRIAVERGVVVNGMKKRCDILVYNEQMSPWLLVECKAPSVKLNQAVFEQIARYNMPLQLPYLLVCNGPDAYCCEVDIQEKTFQFMAQLPVYQ